MKNILKAIALMLPLGALAVSCDISEYNPNQPGYELVFGSAENLQYVVNGFYDQLPKVTNAYSRGNKSDIFISDALDSRFGVGYSSTSNTEWGEWTDVFDANYALDRLSSSAADGLSSSVRNNYRGQFRFFRAYTYYKMLKQYGDLPWYDSVIKPDDTAYEHKERDSRDEIVKHIIDDLDYAIANITAVSRDRTGLTADVARFLKMDVCLYEASFRKYNGVTASVTGKAFSNYTVEQLYTLAADTAKEIMDAGTYSLVSNYRDLFLSDDLQTSEVILGAQTSANNRGSQNNFFLYSSGGTPRSLTRSFVNTYLKADGTPYTNGSDYATADWKDEFTGRDPRLELSVWYPGYQFDGAATVPEFNVAPLGYEMRKFAYDKPAENSTGVHDAVSQHNTNSTPIWRYAEVLLDYAEAKAELGQLTATDWANTIGAIRSRAGITGGLTTLPTSIDSYLQSTYYPNVDNAVILEIRRERSIELLMETSRQDDMIRWGCGEKLATAPWDGVIISAIDTPIDLDGDGSNDVCFYSAGNSAGSEAGVTYVPLAESTADGLYAEAVGSKYQLKYRTTTASRYWASDNHLIVDAIPYTVVENYKTLGYTITQNPGY